MTSQYQSERTTLPTADADVITIICKLIHEADYVLVAAGAGLSAEAGIDYNDTRRFASMFPAFLKRGLKTNYDVMGYDGWTPAAKWAYHAINVQHDFLSYKNILYILNYLKSLTRKITSSLRRMLMDYSIAITLRPIEFIRLRVITPVYNVLHPAHLKHGA